MSVISMVTNDMKAISVLSTVFWISISVSVLGYKSDSRCLIKITDREYAISGISFFHYCNKKGVWNRLGEFRTIECDDQDRLKLLNFNAFDLLSSGYECSNTMNKFRFKQKENTTCLSQSKRNEIMIPFLKSLSGKTVAVVKKMDPVMRTDGQYRRIALDVGCEAETNLKMDMCKPETRIFDQKANVSLFFSVDTYKRNNNHSSCYCYFKTFNTSMKISAQAFDIRLHQHNHLSLNDFKLSPSQIYWWQSGVLGSGFTFLKLSGLSLETLPDSIWMDIYGNNMNITCDTKPLHIQEVVVTNSPQVRKRSSFGSLDVVYIVITVFGVIVFIIIVALVVKYFQSRMSNASKSGIYKVEDPYASETFISSTYEKGEDPPSPNDSIDIHSKPNKQLMLFQLNKNRKGGESEDIHNYEFENEEDEKVNNIDNSVISSEQKISHDAVVHEHPEYNSNIYSHFQDHPDVIPTSSTTNIYGTTAPGIYSSLQVERQHSIPKNS